MNFSALIYTHTITERISYITGFLSQYYGCAFGLTSDEEKFKASSISCKINYSYHPVVPGEIWMHPHALLYESFIRPVRTECREWKGMKIFFVTEGDLGFDLFAAVFYLLSRYEEYLPHQADAYGRFNHLQSLAFREGFLNLPLIELWLVEFKKLLQEKNSEFIHEPHSFNFIPTYDIDIAWAYLNKGRLRNGGAMLALLLKGKWKEMNYRLRVLTGKLPDPFDAYEYLNNLHSHYQLKPIYFFLAAEKKGKYDRNIDVQNLAWKELVHTTGKRYKTGIHPSWASGDEPMLMKKEKAVLEALCEQPVDSSRQHYIRFHLPQTYRRLLKSGITNDYSMGYGGINGFRASISRPFFWYDLKEEKSTQLLVHPFCFMDATSYFEQKYSAAEALDELKKYKEVISAVNGIMITIWHNSFLGTSPQFEGWREIYETFTGGVSEKLKVKT